jgi:hypothetical protein
LYRFTGKRHGRAPLAGLSMDSAGYLYGTTEYGEDKRVRQRTWLRRRV